jgi:TonB family protein
MNFRTAFWFLLALSIHALIIIILAFHFKSVQLTTPPTPSYLPAYVEQDPLVIKKNMGSKILNQSSAENSLSQKILPDSHAHNKTLSTSISSQAAGSNHKVQGQLILLIHNKVQAALIYPPDAQLLQQQGKVAMEFLLQMDGSIEQIKILKTSGYPDLDAAALKTIKNISPIVDAKPLITRATMFVMNVEFY